jgi:hypothetical protein
MRKHKSVILDDDNFERRLKIFNLVRLLAEAETDVSAGRVRPASVFFDEFCRDNDIEIK